MSIGDTFENDLLKLIFNGTTITGIAQNDAAPLTAFYLSLHTADPGETGAQNTSEANYGGYARVSVNRNSGGWTVTANQAFLTANVDFPTSSGSGSTNTFAGIGTASTSTGKLMFSGAISPTIAVGAANITPRLTTASNVSLD